MGPLRARDTNVAPPTGAKAERSLTPSSSAVTRRRSSSPAPAEDADSSPWSHPEVRELLAENEAMLVELASFQALGSAFAKRRLSMFFQEEADQRHALERDYWEAACALTQKASTFRFELMDKALQEATAANDELRGFMALAQDALDPEDDVARRLSTSSTDTKRRRYEDGTADTPTTGEEESGKKRGRTSTHKSPAHLTHMRKTLQPDKLPTTLSVARGESSAR